jgi:hypothetical protein
MPVAQRLVCAKLRTFASQHFRFRFAKRTAALVLAVQMLMLPSPVSAAAIGDAIRDTGTVAAGLPDGLWRWLTLSPPQAPHARGVKSPPPEPLSEKLSRLVRLQINPKGAVQLASQERMLFTAVPFDGEGSAIHGKRNGNRVTSKSCS